MNEPERAPNIAEDLPRWRAWIIEHDDSWLFVISYVTAAVVLSIWISLFWLVVVVGVHGVFEWVRQHHRDPRWPGVAQRMAWELKLDVALVLMGLALAVYMEVALGVAGLGPASRLGVQGGARAARAAVWTRMFRGFALSLDDVFQVGRALGNPGSKEAAEPITAGTRKNRPWRHWGFGDHLAIWLGIACLALILLAPLLMTDQTYPRVWEILLEEMHPFPNTATP